MRRRGAFVGLTEIMDGPLGFDQGRMACDDDAA